MNRTVLLCIAAVAWVAGSAWAKLPPTNDEAKAKAAEAAAKAAYSDKVAGFQLCKVMDKVAAGYLADAKKAGKDVKPTATPTCADPGPFVYPPLEAAGAHSPPQTAKAPPSTTTPAAAQGPAKKQ